LRYLLGHPQASTLPSAPSDSPPDRPLTARQTRSIEPVRSETKRSAQRVWLDGFPASRARPTATGPVRWDMGERVVHQRPTRNFRRCRNRPRSALLLPSFRGRGLRCPSLSVSHRPFAAPHHTNPNLYNSLQPVTETQIASLGRPGCNQCLDPAKSTYGIPSTGAFYFFGTTKAGNVVAKAHADMIAVYDLAISNSEVPEMARTAHQPLLSVARYEASNDFQ
ncbi:hypothetical protein IAQ61_005110, partial [Plenodomus lingam]|uniref:uncharacterized protein n=1 Tax=Leptosphaeria maculans TaxID=5022 RepID=UPI00333071BB